MQSAPLDLFSGLFNVNWLLIVLGVTIAIFAAAFFFVYLNRETIAPWREGRRCGPFELLQFIRGSNAYARSKANIIDLTDTLIDKKAGVSVINYLRAQVRLSSFNAPVKYRDEMESLLNSIDGANLLSQEITVIFGDSANSGPINVTSGRNALMMTASEPKVKIRFSVRIYGIGAFLSAKRILYCILPEGKDIGEYAFASGKNTWSLGGSLTRRLLIGRTFAIPLRIDSLPGIGKQLKGMFFMPYDNRLNLAAGQLEAIDRFNTEILPIAPVIIKTRIFEGVIKNLKKNVSDLQRELKMLQSESSKSSAEGYAVNKTVEAKNRLFGINLGTNGVHGWKSAMMLMIIPVLATAVFEYGFHVDGILGVFTGIALALLFTASK